MKIQLFFTVLFVGFTGQQAIACECIPMTAQETRGSADVVFAGEVTKVQYTAFFIENRNALPQKNKALHKSERLTRPLFLE